MRRWFDTSPLRDREQEGGGGSDTFRVDPGAPHELDHEPDEHAEKPVVKTAAELKVEQLEQDLKDERAKRSDSEKDAKYWSDRAKRAATPAPRNESDDEPEETDPAAEALLREKPEALLDDLTKEGLSALKKRGFISQAELQKELKKIREETQSTIQDAKSDVEFNSRLATEFPDIAADSARVSKGEAPVTPLFKRTGEIYREAVDLDPSLKGSKSLLLMSARQAAAELKKPAKTKADDDETPATRTRTPVDDGQRRRDRIDRQRPDRAPDDDENGRGPSHSAEQIEVMKKLGVKPESFNKHRDAPVGGRNGRK